MPKSQPIYFEFLDNNGVRKKKTYHGCAIYMARRGEAKGNSRNAIAGRYRNREKFGYTLRMCVGLDEPCRIRGAEKARKHKTEVCSVLSVFLKTRLVV